MFRLPPLVVEQRIDVSPALKWPAVVNGLFAASPSLVLQRSPTTLQVISRPALPLRESTASAMAPVQPPQEPARTIKLFATIVAMDAHEDRLVVALSSWILRVYSLQSLQQLDTLYGPSALILSVAMTRKRGSALVACSSLDGAIRVWDLDARGVVLVAHADEPCANIVLLSDWRVIARPDHEAERTRIVDVKRRSVTLLGASRRPAPALAFWAKSRRRMFAVAPDESIALRLPELDALDLGSLERAAVPFPPWLRQETVLDVAFAAGGRCLFACQAMMGDCLVVSEPGFKAWRALSVPQRVVAVGSALSASRCGTRAALLVNAPQFLKAPRQELLVVDAFADDRARVVCVLASRLVPADVARVVKAYLF